MIRSAILRLTLAYLAIFMALSIGFSTVLYNLSTNEVNNGLRRPPPGGVRIFGGFDYEQFRQNRVDESRHRLLENLIIINGIMLAIGAGTSYFLALRTLQPIADAMEMESRFTADASHELRTPLTAMQTEIEVALRDPKLTAKESRDLLKSNLEEVIKLRGLSEGLLTLARGEKNSENFKDLAMPKIIAASVTDVAAHSNNKNIKIVTKIKDAQVRGDEYSLKELFVILLDNAIKYSDTNTSITVSGEKKGHIYTVKVADQGQGIPEADLPHIFERFYRADPSRTKEKIDGYGLGLSIAEHIVQAHDGHIHVTSSSKGSTFSIELPALS